jgi:hypothetical protein
METLQMSLPELQQRFKYMAARSRSVVGRTFEKDKNGNVQLCALAPKLEKFFAELLDSTTNPEKIAKRNEFLERCAADNKEGREARMALNAIRIESFNNYIYATVNIIDFFFEQIILKPDERPVFENTTMNEVKVYYNGPEGEARSYRVDRDDDYQLKNLHYVTTDKVRYKVMDIYRGSIVDAALQTLRLSYDWGNKADNIAFAVLNSASIFGTFAFTGKKQNYPYVANKSINVTNLPTTNDIAVYVDSSKEYMGLQDAGASAPSGGTLSGFGFPVLNAIIDYPSRWAGTDPENELRPTGRILVPSSDVWQFGKKIVPTNSKPSIPAEKLLDVGWNGVHFGGIDWVFIPNNKLAPGTCFPEFNSKAGRAYYKPSMDKDKTINTPELDEKNEEERYIQKVLGVEINQVTRRKLARFKYA